MTFALKGNVIYSKTKDTVFTCENGYALCVDGKSAGVFETLPERYKGVKVIDCGDSLIIPAFVDLHLHAPQLSFSGYGMDNELMDWLSLQTFPEESKYENLEYAKKSYDIFAEELKKSMTGRACIFATVHRESTELLMDALEISGLETYVGKVNMDRTAPDTLREKSYEDSANSTYSWIESVLKKGYKRTKPILTPRFIPSCSDELLDELGKIQRNYGLPVQSHLSESKEEIELVKALRPDSFFYGDAYDEHGLFGKNGTRDVKTVMAHCVWSCQKEVELIKKNGVFVAHCPASNVNLSSGIAPIRKYIDSGLNLGLGTDVAGGHSLSMLRAISDCVGLSKMYMRYVDENATPVKFTEAFYMATKGGGEFFGNAGSFESGYCFDALVLDDSEIKTVEKPTPLQRIERTVYLYDKINFVAKYVSGKEVFAKIN